MVYDGGQITYEQQLRLDGSGTEVISYASILCALPEAATSCRITTRWYTPSDITDDMIAATPDVASAPAGTPASPAINGGTIPQGTSSPSAASYAYHTDQQGSVRAVTDDAKQIVNAYAYDAYGNAEEAVESLTQPYRYTGREWDGVARLYHYRARAYDSETGRFLQEDPIWFNAGDLNVYRYVGNNPVNATDPSGMAVALEERALYSIGLSAAAAITLNQAYRLNLHLKVYDTVTNSQLFKAVSVSVNIANQGLGCLIGLKLSGIGLTILESESANATDDGCAVVGEGAKPGPSNPPEPIAGLIGGKDYQGETGTGTKQYGGQGGTGGRERDFEGIGGEADGKPNGAQVKTLPDGTRVISRPRDTRLGENGGTIEWQSPDGKTSWIKIRY